MNADLHQDIFRCNNLFITSTEGGREQDFSGGKIFQFGEWKLHQCDSVWEGI